MQAGGPAPIENTSMVYHCLMWLITCIEQKNPVGCVYHLSQIPVRLSSLHSPQLASLLRFSKMANVPLDPVTLLSFSETQVCSCKWWVEMSGETILSFQEILKK
jgi:hypothetical protein